MITNNPNPAPANPRPLWQWILIQAFSGLITGAVYIVLVGLNERSAETAVALMIGFPIVFNVIKNLRKLPWQWAVYGVVLFGSAYLGWIEGVWMENYSPDAVDVQFYPWIGGIIGFGFGLIVLSLLNISAGYLRHNWRDILVVFASLAIAFGLRHVDLKWYPALPVLVYGVLFAVLLVWNRRLANLLEKLHDSRRRAYWENADQITALQKEVEALVKEVAALKGDSSRRS